MVKLYRNILILLALISCTEQDDGISYPANTHQSNKILEELIGPELPEKDTVDTRGDTLTYLALGDSYTIGSGVKENERWPVQLADGWRNNGILIQDPYIIAASGWTTGNLLAALGNRNLESNYDLVSLLIGVNNQYQGSDFGIFQRQFIQLLEYSYSKVKSRSGLFILSIPDYGFTPFGQSYQARITEEIDMYNAWIREVCIENNIKYYNITEISRLAGNDLSLLAYDGLHPSAKMYAEWIKLIIADPPKILQE